MAYATKALDQGTFDVLKAEFLLAIEEMPEHTLRNWGGRTAGRLVPITWRRTKNLGGMLASVGKGVWNEAAGSYKAGREGRLGDHLSDRKDAAVVTATAAGQAGVEAWDGAKKLATAVRADPAEMAPELLGAGLGFLAGSGGIDGDGGVPDLDFLGGIGAHRSIFTHSIIGGAMVEATVVAMLDLVATVYHHLPDPHHRLWDQLHDYSERFGGKFVRGADVGIGWHLAIDGTVDGMTPYKDLPVSLSMEGHRAVLLANAAAEIKEGATEKKHRRWRRGR